MREEKGPSTIICNLTFPREKSLLLCPSGDASQNPLGEMEKGKAPSKDLDVAGVYFLCAGKREGGFQTVYRDPKQTSLSGTAREER